MTSVIAFLLLNTSRLLALPIWGLSYKNVYLVVVWKQHFFSVMELCQSHCGQEVRNGTPTLILHLAAQASPSLASPSAASNDFSIPLPARGRTDTWDLGWPVEQRSDAL